MKYHIGLTIDSRLFKEIEELRGREERSTFIEYLIRIGLSNYKTENKLAVHMKEKEIMLR